MRAGAAGAEILDAPVSGCDGDAIAGTTVAHVGPAGAGQVVKVCNQVIVAVVIEAVSEALVLA